jgi:hypothetical protein
MSDILKAGTRGSSRVVYDVMVLVVVISVPLGCDGVSPLPRPVIGVAVPRRILELGLIARSWRRYPCFFASRVLV